MKKSIIAIDPGALGAIVVYHPDSGIVKSHKMPQEYPEMFNLLQEIYFEERNYGNIVCYLEKVGHGMPGQSSKATASFARHNGHLEMALYAIGVKTIEVTPQKWQRYFSNNVSKPKSADKSAVKRAWKNALKAEAMRRFPDIPVTLNNADALLIAVYAEYIEK